MGSKLQFLKDNIWVYPLTAMLSKSQSEESSQPSVNKQITSKTEALGWVFLEYCLHYKYALFIKNAQSDG